MSEKNIDYKLIGRNIRDARKSLGITQDALCSLTSLSVNHISHIETGASPLSLPALLAICEALNTTADRLLYDNLTQQTAYLNKDIAECFSDANPAESYVMLSVANAAKESMRAKKL